MSMVHVNQLGAPPQMGNNNSMLGGASSKIEASFDSQHPLSVRPLGSARSEIQIEHRVNEQLSQSIGLWNNMMA